MNWEMKDPAIEKKPIENKELRQYIKRFPRARIIKESNVTYHKILNDRLLIVNAIRHGVTTRLFDEIKSNAPFDDQQWSVFLNLNIRTLQRYRADKKHVFKPIHSEKIFELAELVALGNIVFDSQEDFTIWLSTPSVALGRVKPVDLLDSSYGMQLIMAELNMIEYGVFV
jgi:putative toxin-antitoxin system antitoxin component (TIGR02293 family)